MSKIPVAPILTSLEELVLRALCNSDQAELYGLQVQEGIEIILGKKIPVGTLYPILERLRAKGYIQDRWEKNNKAKRSGARRRYYKITDDGYRVLIELDEKREELMDWTPIHV